MNSKPTIQIHLVFKMHFNSQIKKIWNILKENGIGSDKLATSNYDPFVTVSCFPAPGVPHLGLVCETPEIFQELAFSTKRFPVCFNKGKCTFNNESTVELSFSCISSKELVRFQNRLHKSLEKLMYQRGRSMTQGFDMESWTPSCPIARGVENEDITKAWNLICSYLDLPIIADAVGFKEVMFIPENQCYEELSFYQFAGHDGIFLSFFFFFFFIILLQIPHILTLYCRFHELQQLYHSLKTYCGERRLWINLFLALYTCLSGFLPS